MMEKIEYILSFLGLICEMLRIDDANMPPIYLIYGIWDLMIEWEIIHILAWREDRKWGITFSQRAN